MTQTREPGYRRDGVLDSEKPEAKDCTDDEMLHELVMILSDR